jgi:hypothetical protein
MNQEGNAADSDQSKHERAKLQPQRMEHLEVIPIQTNGQLNRDPAGRSRSEVCAYRFSYLSPTNAS